MFVGPDQYTTTLERMVADESALDVAVAFWGQGADSRIHPNESKPIRVICNLRSGGPKPLGHPEPCRESRDQATCSSPAV